MDILIIGAGGIGSHLAEFLNKACIYGQLNDDIVFMDDDIVERKNLSYQNFGTEDLSKKKVRVIEKRYMFRGLDQRATKPEHFTEYDLVVLAVDNNEARKLVYEHAKDWIDLRSKGKVVSVFTKSDKDMKEFLGGEGTDIPQSCQNKFELDKNVVQYGNLISASIGVQAIVNRTRGVSIPKQFIQGF